VLSAAEVTIVLEDPDVEVPEPSAADGVVDLPGDAQPGVDGPDRWLTAASAGADPTPDPPQFAPPPEVTVEDAPAGTADRLAAAHDLTIERASIIWYGDDDAVVDLALRDPAADVIVNLMLKQLADPESSGTTPPPSVGVKAGS
jgi:hypothetical protein